MISFLYLHYMQCPAVRQVHNPEWMKDRGIDGNWMKEHRAEVADALDSFLIGGLSSRRDVLDMLAELPPEKREAWRARRQDRHRSSVNAIGEAAYKLAAQLRKTSETNGDDAKPKTEPNPPT